MDLYIHIDVVFSIVTGYEVLLNNTELLQRVRMFWILNSSEDVEYLSRIYLIKYLV